jgi:2-C-methyl-D-erythritol 4-phosphate cytidylyltransferase / 2-C-methyl-D-erythritol 2,4-cyclodiphosphate synthase
VVAAGRGVRAAAGGVERKQYRPIGGVPMLRRALQPFLDHPRVAMIAVVLPPSDAKAPPEWLAAVALAPGTPRPLIFVAGGEARQQSVAHGLAVLPGVCSVVLVHDAARPFADRALVDRVLAEADRGAAVVPGIPVADTLKETDAAGLVVRTLPREGLVAVQTPQGFPRATLEAAHHRAGADASATDDAALCERLGIAVRVVAGNRRNIKVTTAEDFALAEALAAAEPAA